MQKVAEKVAAKHNYLITLIKSILFIVLFCFLVTVSKNFFREIKVIKDFELDALSFSVIATFLVYSFLVNLNNLYDKIQNFFFHGSALALVIPALLVIVGICYFIFPRVFNVSIDRYIFIFIGGVIFVIHMIYVASEIRGTTFPAFMHYLFLFSILYMANLLFFGIYLNAKFNVPVGDILINGVKDGILLIKNIFSQIFK